MVQKERYFMNKKTFVHVLYALIFTFGKEKAGMIFDNLLFAIKKDK